MVGEAEGGRLKMLPLKPVDVKPFDPKEPLAILNGLFVPGALNEKLVVDGAEKLKD